MFEELQKIKNNSYSPYSNFKVSSILVTKDLKKYRGVNIENSSYGGSICAERVAINTAIANGETKDNFKEIHVLGDSFSMPCFICRQVFVEFFDENVDLYVYNKDGSFEKYKALDICPEPFELEN